MITIGLTGSIAMGKSEVAKLFREAGIPVFDADAEVQALYASSAGADLLRPLVPEAITPHGVDRTSLTQSILQDQHLLAKLETIVHAEIARRRNEFRQRCEKGGHNLILFDIPLLFETGGDQQVDVTIVVSAPTHLQRQRALARPGMTAEKLDMILARQMPDAEKRKRADHILENDGTLEDLRTKTRQLIDHLKQQEASHA